MKAVKKSEYTITLSSDEADVLADMLSYDISIPAIVEPNDEPAQHRLVTLMNELRDLLK